MSNKAIWTQVCTTDPKFTKRFSGKGGFSGTSANPMYLAERCTEIFGPAGIGWGHDEIEHLIAGHGDEQVWFAHVKFWYINDDGERGEVSHWGSSALTEWRAKKTDNPYIFLDHEAAKKARTNAVSKCLSLLGFCADLWLGYYDSQQYQAEAAAVTEERKRRESHESAAGLLAMMLNSGFGCETDEDRAAVLTWAYGEPMETADDPRGAQGVIKAKIKEAGLSYPDVLKAAKGEA